MNKFYIRIFFLTIVMVAAVIYAFSVLGSPFQERDKKIDQKRVDNISNLKSAIDGYYSKYKKLPDSLDEVFKDSAYSYYKQYSQDPVTGKQYAYSVDSLTSYQLCATFSTETDKNTDAYRPIQFDHPKGNYCFNLEVTSAAIMYAAGSNKRYLIQSTSLAHTSAASGSAQTGVTPISEQVFADPHIQSVTTNLYSYYSSVTASDSTYTAYANYPTGFFSDNPGEWGLISISPQPVTVSVTFKNPVKLKSVASDFTPGCPQNNPCIEWKIVGIATNGNSINLYSGFGGAQPDRASIATQDQFTQIDITASMTSAHEIGYLYWRKIGFEYLQ